MSRMPRVCQVCSMHPDDDARVFDRACVSLAEEGYDVHLVARSERSNVYRHRGVTIHPAPKFGSIHERIRGARRIARLAGETGAGLAVDPASPRQIADAIMRLLADPELARRMGEAGKKAVRERFNWEVEWPKLKALYERLLVTRSGG